MISVSSYTYFCLQKMLNSACMQSLKYIPWISNYWSDTKLKTVVKKAELKKDSPVPAPSRTPPRKTLLANGSLSHTVSSRHTLSRSLCCRPQYVKVWFQRGFTARFTTAVLCFVLFLSSGSRYLIHKKKRSVSLRSVRSRREREFTKCTVYGGEIGGNQLTLWQMGHRTLLWRLSGFLPL